METMVNGTAPVKKKKKKREKLCLKCHTMLCSICMSECGMKTLLWTDCGVFLKQKYIPDSVVFQV